MKEEIKKLIESGADTKEIYSSLNESSVTTNIIGKLYNFSEDLAKAKGISVLAKSVKEIDKEEIEGLDEVIDSIQDSLNRLSDIRRKALKNK